MTEEKKTVTKKPAKKVSEEKIVRDNITYLGYKSFRYDCISIEACSVEGYFLCAEARNLAVKKGDVMMLVSADEVAHIIVK